MFGSKFKIILFVVTAWICFPIQAKENRETKLYKYNLSICTIFRNEAKYLKEWIEYHLLVGVEHFYLYNNKSTDSFLKTLTPYIKEGLVTLIDWPDRLGHIDEEHIQFWALSTQIPAYENAVKFRANTQTKWLVILDPDEYLVPIEKKTLTELLEKYNQYPGVTLKSEFFNASSPKNAPPRKLLIQSVKFMDAPRKNIQKGVAKTIFKPNQCTSFTWPPYEPIFKNKQIAKVIEKYELKINQYINRGKESNPTSAPTLYYNSRTLSEGELSSLIERGYEIEDSEPAIFRFVPELMKKIEPAGNK